MFLVMPKVKQLKSIYLAELARLLTMQQSYLEKENYEKAAVIRDKITKIELKLKNI